jgi:sulfate transport system permease protein
LLVVVCLLYLGFLVLLPLGAVIWTAVKPGWSTIVETFTAPDVRHAFYLTAIIAIQTVVVCATLGSITAWVLVRHRFVGRRFMNALVDLPLAVSPVTVGIAAVLLFGRGGWFNAWFTARGIEIVYALPSMVLVTIFICLRSSSARSLRCSRSSGPRRKTRRGRSAPRRCRRCSG